MSEIKNNWPSSDNTITIIERERLEWDKLKEILAVAQP